MKARNFSALALVSSISAFLCDSVEAAPTFSRCGSAVWFADSGGLTASGETNEPGAFSAAHRSLPFGTEVRVENLANGRSAVVRVNDRAPFTGGRIISVSSAAADELDMKSEGVAEVRLTLLDDDNPQDDSCGAVASAAEASTVEASRVEAGGDLPPDEPKARLPAAVVSYAEADDSDPGLPEAVTAPRGTEGKLAERFVIAFQSESAANLPLKRALGTKTSPFVGGLLEGQRPADIGSTSSDTLILSTVGAENWPVLDGLPPIEASPVQVPAP